MSRFTYTDIDIPTIIHNEMNGEFVAGEWTFDDKKEADPEEARSAALAYIALYEHLTKDVPDSAVVPGQMVAKKASGGQVAAIVFIILILAFFAVWAVAGFVHGVGLLLGAWTFDKDWSVTLLLPFFGLLAALIVRILNAVVVRLRGTKK